ncbi:YacL family protein [Amycolatopsis lurida]|uniref:hypothetical protein n=1 Tax=Amycolatopsis lurida TaxID=31959 RepID=UPI0036692B08
MEYEFTVDAEGLVAVALSADLPLMGEALQDSIGTHPPVGAAKGGPSTYWIDEALKGLRARIEDDSDEPFASGNMTYLRAGHGVVEARYDYAPDDDQLVDAVPVDEFVDLLGAWRRRVLAESPTADQHKPPPPHVWTMPPG